ncbi:MAG: flavin reductase family protein [Planctomycetota bacterium]
MDATNPEHIRDACGRLSSGVFLISSCHDASRAATLTAGVHQCAAEPVLLAVPMHKGHPIEPLIRDSRSFAITALRPDDRVARRRFGGQPPADRLFDPFDAVAVRTLVSRAPILRDAPLGFDCEVVRHVDLEADHELYIGRVLAVYAEGDAPAPLRAADIEPLDH